MRNDQHRLFELLCNQARSHLPSGASVICNTLVGSMDAQRHAHGRPHNTYVCVRVCVCVYIYMYS